MSRVRSFNSLRATAIFPNAPASWASVSQIQPEFLNFLRNYFRSVEKYDIFSHARFPVASDLWIFPIGVTQAYSLNWLRKKFTNPLSRPPAIFILNGEGAKLGYHLLHYRDVFRPDDQWVVACQAEKDLLDEWFPDNGRTHIMYHPVSSSFRPLSGANGKLTLRKKLGLPARKKLLLYAGRISQQKNVTELLDLLKKNPNLHLIICGDTDSLGLPHLPKAKAEHIPSTLAHRIDQLGVSPQIEFRPFQSQDQLCLYMQACDYQISLSAHYGEDFGYSIAQGLHCGLGTILTQWGGHRNWITQKLETQVSYLSLDWSNHKEVGKPVGVKNLKLPQGKAKRDFPKFYQATLKAQFESIIQSIHASEPIAQKSLIQACEPIEAFWLEVSQTPRSGMFPSPKHSLFRKVVEAYLGQRMD